MGAKKTMIECIVLYQPSQMKDPENGSTLFRATVGLVTPQKNSVKKTRYFVRIPKLKCGDSLEKDMRLMVFKSELTAKPKKGEVTVLLTEVEILEEIDDVPPGDEEKTSKRKREEEANVIHRVKREKRRREDVQSSSEDIAEFKDVIPPSIVNLQLQYLGSFQPNSPSKKKSYYILHFAENPSNTRISMFVFEEDFPYASVGSILTYGSTYAAKNVMVQKPFGENPDKTLKFLKAETSFVFDEEASQSGIPILEANEDFQKLDVGDIVSIVGAVVFKGPLRRDGSGAGTRLYIGSPAEETAIRVVNFSSHNCPFANIRVGEAAVFYEMRVNLYKGMKCLVLTSTSHIDKEHPKARPYGDWWENATPLQRGTTFSLKTIAGETLMKDVLFERDYKRFHWVSAIFAEVRNMDEDPSLPIGLFCGTDGCDFEVPLEKDIMEGFLGNPENFEDAMNRLTCCRVNLLIGFSMGRIALEHFAITSK